jgi:hypothetical protein
VQQTYPTTLQTFKMYKANYERSNRKYTNTPSYPRSSFNQAGGLTDAHIPTASTTTTP